MVGHQHPGPDLYSSRRAMLGKQLARERIGRVFEEGLRAAVATLRDVVGDAPEIPRVPAGPCGDDHLNHRLTQLGKLPNSISPAKLNFIGHNYQIREPLLNE